MADIVSPTVRSRMMSGIRSKNTKAEWVVRRELHRRGLRYRLHASHLIGTPDIVFPGRKAVIFVSGCFWHGHDCHLFRLPKTRPEFWSAKINRNRDRDDEVRSALQGEGWRCFTIWECALGGKGYPLVGDAVDQFVYWLDGAAVEGETGEKGDGSRRPSGLASRVR